jgi:hypothetical protein
MTTAAPIFAKTLAHEGHVRSFRIQPEPAIGWVASERNDSREVMHREYSDWHRVERLVMRFAGEVHELEANGWVGI